MKTLARSFSHLRRRSAAAFSLVEALAAVAIIGIITFLALPNIVQLKSNGERNIAIARSEAFTMGVSGYIAAKGLADAATEFNGIGAAADRYDKVRPYLQFSPDWTQFMPDGFRLDIAGLTLPSTNTGTLRKPTLYWTNPATSTEQEVVY